LSAVRAIGRAAMSARALRECTAAAAVVECQEQQQDDDDAAISVRDARDQLAGILREEAIRVLLMNGIPAQAREDLAQNLTLTVLTRIVDGAVEPGFEDGYLAVAAKNRARDWHREKSGVYEKTEAYDEDVFVAPDLDPLSALCQIEEEADERALVDRVVNVLHTAPPRYRDVLVAVYLDGVSIDTLVEQELFRELPWPADGGDDPIATRRRARARVDKLLQRARDWVRARILAARTTPPPPMSPTP
jgi:RNA polymerase sigma factor (sigma-70 family)